MSRSSSPGGCDVRTFSSDNVSLAFVDEGEGAPVLLIHGFCTNMEHNWRRNGWMQALKTAGFRVVAFDSRGHGRSEPLYAPELYGLTHMSEDAVRLLDHLDLGRVDVIGYSDGARIAAALVVNHPERVGRAVFGGLGYTNAFAAVTSHGMIARALEAPTLEAVKDFIGRSMRMFAESNGNDLRAMSAYASTRNNEEIPPEAYGDIRGEVLIVAGTQDAVAGSTRLLADIMPNARVHEIEGRGHLNAMHDTGFQEAVVDFLREGRDPAG